VQPAVAKVVFVEGCARTQGKQLIQGAILLGPVPRFFRLPPWKPLQDLWILAVNGPQRSERILWCELVQVRILPVEGRLQDLVYLMQCHRVLNLQEAKNGRHAVA
jgi:hypothetical protein